MKIKLNQVSPITSSFEIYVFLLTKLNTKLATLHIMHCVCSPGGITVSPAITKMIYQAYKKLTSNYYLKETCSLINKHTGAKNNS